MVDKSEIFFKVFSEIPFPFLAINISELLKGLKKNTSPHSYLSIEILKNNKRNFAFINSLSAILKKITPNDDIINLLKKSPLVQFSLIDLSNLPNLIFSKSGSRRIFVTDKLYWDEDSYWPLAYGTFLQQILNIIKLFESLLNQTVTNSKISNPIISAEYPRNMPTEIQYAAASLGSWLGGAANFQYFSLYATKYQIKNSNKNLEYLKYAGYNEHESQEFDLSGMVGVPASLASPLIETQGNHNIFGSISIDEYNLSNPPNGGLQPINKEKLLESKLTGFIVDKYYRTVFFAKKLESQGLYGSMNVLRDHYTDFYNSVNTKCLMRCKHYCVPIIEVNTTEEIYEIVSRIPKRGKGGLFYRGQTSFYPLKRTETVKKLLYNESNSFEPSLVTSSSRDNFDYDNLHFALKHYLGENMILNSRKFEEENFSSKVIKWQNLIEDPTCKFDYAIMALAQHYGLPSHGLDVTTSIDVALWFATNKYKLNPDGISSYVKLDYSSWPTDEANFPTVFVCQTVLNTSIPSLQDCQELNELGIIAERPIRQNAKFFLGGHSDHQNRLAESVVCALRLCPNNYETKVDFNYLFPKFEEDYAYKIMSDFSNNEIYSSIVKKKINKFHNN